MIRKKLLKKVSKKLMALLLSIAMLFSNLMPLSTIFALMDNDEKADLVQINVRRAEGIEIDGNTATIQYEGGVVTVSGNNLSTEEIPWDYGEYMGTVNAIYTTSTSLTFDADPNPGNKVFCYFDGHMWENNDENFTMNGLETFSVHHEYEIEFEFMDVNAPDPEFYTPSEPTGATYQIDFGGNSWEIDGRTVYASIAGKDLTNGPVEVSDYDVIEMHNYDGGMMEIVLRGEHQFNVGLFTNGENETNLTFIKQDGTILPGDGVLTFEVVPRQNDGPNNDIFHIDFGEATWYFDDGNTVVTASVEGRDLTHGPVELAGDEEIVLTNFDPSRMQVRVMVEDGFTFLMNVGGDGRFTPHSTPEGVQLPNDLHIDLYVENLGDEPDPNPPQEGEHTAKIRVNGVEGSFIYRYIDDFSGDELEEEIFYDGPRESAANIGTRFSINHGATYQLRTNGIGDTFDDVGWYLYNEIEYNYDDLDGEDPNYIKLWLGTPFEAKYSNVIRINNVDYNVSELLDYSDREEWLSGLTADGNIGFELKIPKTQDDVYEITVQVDPSEYYYLGRYEWTNEEYDSDWPSYIGHSSIEIETVSFEYGGEIITYSGDRFNEDFDDFLIHYEVDPNNNVDRGMLMAPDDAVITVRIIPEYGYQVTNVTATGGYMIDDIGEYVFTIPKSEEDFQVEVTPVDDTIVVDHQYIDSGSIDFGTSHFPGGTANTEIGEAYLSAQEIENFNAYAGNYQIKQLFNVMVEAVLYKGTDEDAWAAELEGLDRYTQVTLHFTETISGDEVVVLHQTGDNQFETLNNVAFDKQNNTITFKTMNYGNFAIATFELVPIEGIAVMVDPPTPGVTVQVTQENDPETNEPYFVGDPAPFVAVNSTEPYYVDRTGWVRGNCLDGSGTCREFFNSTFEVNGEYYALISVTAKEGNRFTYDTLDHITVNGRDLDTDNGDAITYVDVDGRNIVFVTKVTITSGEEPQVLKGDLNGNGKIDLADIIALLKKYLNDNATPEDMAVCDMDYDGNINLKDIILLLKAYLSGE